MKRKMEIAVLVVYTLINLKLILPFVSNDNMILAVSTQGGGAPNFTAIFVSLFLNTALIIYSLRKEALK